MSEVHETRLGRRVAEAAGPILKRSRQVSAVDLFVGLRWLRSAQVDEWRQGRVPHLEDALGVRPDRVDAALRALGAWARGQGLEPSEAAYLAATRDRRPLRFTRDGGEALERACRVHWVRADLTGAQRERLAAKQAKAPDLEVLVPERDGWHCASCRGTGRFQLVEDGAPLCLACADLDHLAFLPSGDAALTRRAKKESGLSALVVQLNRRRKRYERRGLLVEEAALARAEEQCLADGDARARRRERDQERRAAADVELRDAMAAAIGRLFPGCPPERAAGIAAHAAVRGSGRVGRTAAGRDLDPEAVTLAVIASVRHLDTRYDALLMGGTPRREARAAIRADVDRVLARWRG
ncbi:DUF2293 domain-containing protein [Actinomadura parmotrematis]|uniref:DUF2293 domain-containing protein n=1 Tax=Actinomadura parmotrematis TaxID=2864039 RepID=A0ABS7FYX0_9ACTN|nr:DUF2293 domain-containing protein [Actinomadura parmotrematis]MBW8485644.1 DUF2293 domain-containing protein [Actinomadura parmotrematis]